MAHPTGQALSSTACHRAQRRGSGKFAPAVKRRSGRLRTMPTIVCTLGTDPADATLNRPVLVLRPAEREEVLPLVRRGTMPLLAVLLGTDGTLRRTFGASELPRLR